MKSTSYGNEVLFEMQQCWTELAETELCFPVSLLAGDRPEMWQFLGTQQIRHSRGNEFEASNEYSGLMIVIAIACCLLPVRDGREVTASDSRS